MKRKDRVGAEKVAMAAVMNDPSQINAQIFAEAVRNHEAGNLIQAEALYRALLTLQPTHVDAWYNLGLLLQVAGQLERAVAVYREGLTQNPRHSSMLSNLGTALKDLGQFDEAV